MDVLTQDLSRLRRRALFTLFGGVGVATIPFYAAATISPIVAGDIGGSDVWGGLAFASGVVGTGIGATVLSRVMARAGRRAGLVLGYFVAASGCGIAVVGATARSLPLFLAGLVLLGVGHASSQLARYVAAELAPPERRASALGLIVWGSTVGAILGPNVVSFFGARAARAGLPELSGGFVAGVIAFALVAVAMLALLRPDPSEISIEDATDIPVATGLPLTDLLRAPRAQVAMGALVAAQFVMILIMAMTPLHVRGGGHGLGTVGVVMSAHFVGMFGLAPLTGRMTDRLGHLTVIWSGFVLLAVAAVLAARMPVGGGAVLAVPLFLLGLGWNSTFVAGSALLTEGLAYGDRARLQGTTDTVVWICAALASLISGVILTLTSFSTLCVVGAVLLVVPAVTTAARRRALAPAS